MCYTVIVFCLPSHPLHEKATCGGVGRQPSQTYIEATRYGQPVFKEEEQRDLKL